MTPPDPPHSEQDTAPVLAVEAPQVTALRHEVIEAHRSAFDLLNEVIRTLETAALQPHEAPLGLPLALEMLLYQGVRSAAAVALLAQHALIEDAATIVRRLMEMAVIAGYLGNPTAQAEQTDRAERYLAFLWRYTPPEFQAGLPQAAQQGWMALNERVGNDLKQGAKRWAPPWKTMFEEMDASETYEADYGFLSSVAHGSPGHLVDAFSRERLHQFDHRIAWSLLEHAAKYLCAIGGIWNEVFELVPELEMVKLMERVTSWRKIHRPSEGTASTDSPIP